jgi:predicted nucleic acid-binding protein
MTTTKHLQRIKDKCLANLAIAEKRTQGKWAVEKYTNYHGFSVWASVCCIAERWYKDAVAEKDAKELEGNAAYIAACAGAAEAGWRSTIAAIEWIEQSHDIPDAYSQTCVDDDVQQLAAALIAAWPEETL